MNARTCLIGLGITLGAVLAFLGCQPSAAENQVCFKKNCVTVEIAQTQAEISRGLMYRESLPKTAGMLFVFSDSATHGFWMKNTLIPLDIIWMDYGRRIVHIEKNVPPCKRDPCPSYRPAQNASYVLEINAHHSDQMGFQLGDTMDFYLKSQHKI